MKSLRLSRSPIAVLASVAGLALSMGVAHADPAPVQTSVVTQPAQSSTSRAEVKADFLVWRAAGMLNWDYDGADIYSAAYQQDLANYKAVRTSPQFAVIERAVEQGQTPRVSLSENPLRVSIATQ